MAIRANFIPQMWSKKIEKELALAEVIAKDVNKEFEGEVKMGNLLKILTAETATIGTYVPGTDIDIETQPGIITELPINQFKYFAFEVDDIEKAQALPALESSYLKTARNGLVEDSENFLAGLASGVTDTNQIVAKTIATPDDALDGIEEALNILYDNKVPQSEDTVIEISPTYYLLLKHKLTELSTSNPEYIKSGVIGRYGNAKIKMTPAFGTKTQANQNLYVRTKNSIAYVDKIVNVENHRKEKGFSDIVKGLHIYGGVISRPKELVVVQATLAV